jgi:hypothetical protein
MIDNHIYIEELIQAIRQRMAYGMGPMHIAKDLGRFFPQSDIFLCYHAAKLLENN